MGYSKPLGTLQYKSIIKHSAVLLLYSGTDVAFADTKLSYDAKMSVCVWLQMCS